MNLASFSSLSEPSFQSPLNVAYDNTSTMSSSLQYFTAEINILQLHLSRQQILINFNEIRHFTVAVWCCCDFRFVFLWKINLDNQPRWNKSLRQRIRSASHLKTILKRSSDSTSPQISKPGMPSKNNRTSTTFASTLWRAHADWGASATSSTPNPKKLWCVSIGSVPCARRETHVNSCTSSTWRRCQSAGSIQTIANARMPSAYICTLIPKARSRSVRGTIEVSVNTGRRVGINTPGKLPVRRTWPASVRWAPAVRKAIPATRYQSLFKPAVLLEIGLAIKIYIYLYKRLV